MEGNDGSKNPYNPYMIIFAKKEIADCHLDICKTTQLDKHLHPQDHHITRHRY